ncbi:MAG TPA: DUF5343 domain-containing protein, partial [Dehalococcoidales bacterium]|nr:DUF5343 domain-containing protein [Dehalococcoidales bacterium]
MAEEKKKEVFPVLPVSNWWDLRKRFRQTIPTAKITDTYLSSVLSIGILTARNLLSPLKRMGILEQDGVPRDRAKAWRDDEQYPQVCESIRKEIYPQELVEAFPR